MSTTRTTHAAVAGVLLLTGALATSAVAQTPKAEAPPAPADVAAPPPDAQRTPTGLASKVLQPGSGDKRPSPTDLVTVFYTGWTADGRSFDSSVARGRPSTFPLDRVLPGWSEGVQLMVVGEKRRLWVPEALAYKGQAGKPRGMLVFDIELLDFQAPPGVAPPDVAGPPKDARRTPSGLAYKVLRQGTGTRRPSERSTVTVHYTGWTTDGKMFDSSVARGRPATFPLTDVIKGWTEGVSLMVEGERTRFWIPQDLAYQGKPGQPRGTLVFDIELISIAK